jgi:hypothetical protein
MTKQFSVCITPLDLHKLRTIAEEQETSLASIVRKLITEYLKGK